MGSFDHAEIFLIKALKIRENLQNISNDYQKELEESRIKLKRLAIMRAQKSTGGASSTTVLNPLKVPSGMCFSPPGSSPSLSGKSHAPNSFLKSSNFDSLPASTLSASNSGFNTGTTYNTSSTGADRSSCASEQSLNTTPMNQPGGQNNKLLLDAVHDTELEVKLLRDMVGRDHPNVADMLTKLADLYCRLRFFGKMEPVLIESLRIREVAYGMNHLSVATELKNLAMLYLTQERLVAAEPLLKRAIAIRESQLGSHHVKVADVEHVYVSLLRKSNRQQQADAIERHIKDVRAGAHSDNGVSALSSSSSVSSQRAG